MLISPVFLFMKTIVTLLMVVTLLSCIKEKAPVQTEITSQCDTVNFIPSLSVHIVPILYTHCTSSCHNSINHQGSWDLSHYNDTLGNYGLHTAASSGALSCSIIQNSSCGYEAMPKGSPKIDNCSISVVVKWVRSGAPRN